MRNTHKVIVVILVNMMPSQPSMIESWSFADLRCNVYEKERQRSMAAEMDRPVFSAREGGRRVLGESGKKRARRTSWARLVIGSSSTIAGSLWLLSILGFSVPWFALLPMAMMFAGSFIIAASLNQRAISEMAAHDRCDH